jgi:hypothetical protein
MKKTVLVIVLLILVYSVSASYISIQTNVEYELDNVEVSVSNLGDEPAKDVQISAELSGQKKTGNLNKKVGINETVNNTFQFEIDGMNGQYPLIVTTEYSDMNSYPFSSTTVSLFSVGETAGSDIFGKIDPVELKENVDLEIVLKNLGNEDREVDLKFVVPKELTLEKTEGKLMLEAGKEGELNLNLERFSALPGSTYLVYSIAEYDQGGIHFTSITSATVRVVENKKFEMPIWMYFAGLVVLIGAVIYYQYRK